MLFVRFAHFEFSYKRSAVYVLKLHQLWFVSGVCQLRSDDKVSRWKGFLSFFFDLTFPVASHSHQLILMVHISLQTIIKKSFRLSWEKMERKHRMNEWTNMMTCNQAPSPKAFFSFSSSLLCPPCLSLTLIGESRVQTTSCDGQFYPFASKTRLSRALPSESLFISNRQLNWNRGEEVENNNNIVMMLCCLPWQCHNDNKKS